jgi:hypothetical protein
MKYTGWYDSPIQANGNLVLSYWNHVVNEFPSIGNDHNDIRRYSKEHYVQACKDYMNTHTFVEPNRKFIIDIPLTEVYSNGQAMNEDGYPEDMPIWKTSEWVTYVVNELRFDDRVVGWYQADEPEVWGYREVINGNVVNNSPKIPYTFLKERYDLIKSLSEKPVVAVFCDPSLFKARFYNDILSKGKFFDIFGFDYYPFTPSNSTVDERKMKQFIYFADSILPTMPILFVGQGSGGLEFGNRVPTLDEHERLFKAFIKLSKKSNRFGYLLWSGSTTYASPEALNLGNKALSNTKVWEREQDSSVTPSLLQQIISIIKRLFRK